MNNLLTLKEKFKSGQIQKPEYITQMYQFHRKLHEWPELLKGSAVSKIEITSDGVIATINKDNIKLHLVEGDERLIPIEAMNFGEYEPDELSMMSKLASFSKCFFDIGGNIGLYSITFAKRFPSLEIHTFEPLPRTYENLTKNLELNGCSKVKVNRLGLSDKKGELTFFFDAEGSGSASMQNVSGKTTAQEIKCPVETLDSYVAREKASVDFIKCDVEGAELLVLKGGITTLREQKPILFLEMLRKWAKKFNYHPNDIISFLSECGYKCYSMSGATLVNISEVTEETKETNFIFLHQEKHKNLDLPIN